MRDPIPPRKGSVRATILRVLPVDGSPMARRDLVQRVLTDHLQTGYPAIMAALLDGARGAQPLVVREDRPGGVFYSRGPGWMGREVVTTTRATCGACGGVIVAVPVAERCAGHRGR